jgi:RNA polymerase sigma-70 factor (ECF subfamily)
MREVEISEKPGRARGPEGEDTGSPLVRAKASFSAFYAAEHRQVVGLAYVLSGSSRMAEDLAQEAFLAAFREWDRVGLMDRPGAWVRRVVANRAVSWLRRSRTEMKALLRLGGSHAVDIVVDLPESATHVLEAVRRLPSRQAQAIALHYWDGLEAGEIAEVLGISPVSVHTHLQRARKTLAGRLGEEEGR